MALVHLVKNLFDREASISDNLLSNNRFQLILLILGYMLIAAGIILGLKIVLPLFIKFINIVSPFILAFILAYIMNPGLRFMQEKFEFSRSGALMIVTVFIAGTLGLALFMLTLLISQQMITLVDDISPVIQVSADGEVIYDPAYQEYAASEEPPTGESEEAVLAELSSLLTEENDTGTSTPGAVTTLPENADKTAAEIALTEPVTRWDNEPQIASQAGTTAAGNLATSAPKEQKAGAASRVAGVEEVPWWNRLYQGAAKRFGDLLPLGSGADGAPEGLSIREAASGGTQLAVYIGKQIFTIFNKVIGGLIFLGFTIAVTFFMLLFYDQICRGFWLLVPFQYRDKTADLLAQIDHAIGGYLRGQLSVCFVVGFLWGFWLIIMGMPRYAILIGSITGAMNLIPYVGPFVGLASGFVYVLAMPYAGPGGILGGIIFLLVGYSLLQVIESMILQPKLVGDAAQLNPLVVIFALLVGAQFGMGGMLLAVPVAAVIRVLLIEFFWKSYMEQQRAKADEVGEDDISGGAYERYDAMLGRLEERKRQKSEMVGKDPGFMEESMAQIAAIFGRLTGTQEAVAESGNGSVSAPVGRETEAAPPEDESPEVSEPKERLSQPTNMPKARRRTSLTRQKKGEGKTAAAFKPAKNEAPEEENEKSASVEPTKKTTTSSKTDKAKTESVPVDKDPPAKSKATKKAAATKSRKTTSRGAKSGTKKPTASKSKSAASKTPAAKPTRKRTTRRKKTDSTDKS